MRSLEVIRNSSVLCVAGTANASLLSIQVSLFIEQPNEATLRVSGMNELENNRSSHTYWFEEEVLSPGESLSIRFSELGTATPPAIETATDSAEYIAEHERYESEVAQGAFEPREVEHKWPNGSLSFSVQGTSPVVATFAGGREFITLSLTWNKWRPDVCRYSLSSFSQAEAVARTGSNEWLDGKLQLEQSCQVSLGT